MHIMDYADLGTKIYMEKARHRSFLLLQPGHLNQIGKVLTLINKAHYFISNIKSTKLSAQQLKNNGIESKGGVVVAVGVVSPINGNHSSLWPSLIQDVSNALGAKDAVWAKEASCDGTSFYPSFFQEEGVAPSSAVFEEGNVTLGLIKVRSVQYFVFPHPPSSFLMMMNTSNS